ncbi:YlmC/YmxH family sporulation protein [Lachnotalea glycerini]|uniref:YlmC/YmxH family sporulation protein n=1 Tax=Lachnotalea glycerini TaxID=1763509 RepID=A0A255IJ00_9FIRM|nr:YlmC/YmxH family sporulation protein [Lachnotalea glycerini]PXV96018.1 YlmC/YmxH family sporulation protein [Lachnotalea glycerini]RDY30196.1 YlmC/YmxH family sporulation protein [Lachnotalea glycerini]
MRLCEFKDKQVINLCDCRVLGCVGDIIFNECTGKITDIIVPGPGRVCGIFGRDSEYIIPWNHICKIGPDIILVEIKDDCKPQRIPI